MKAIIDGDIVAFRCAASLKEDDPLEIGIIRADRLMNQIIQDVNGEPITFLSGARNFRKEIYPAYKANRTKPKPQFLNDISEFLIHEWGAEVADGYEADDAIGIKACETTETTICSIDKDFRQIPRVFYNFVKNEFEVITELEAKRTFYKQLLLGDKSDNIPGWDGMPRQKPTNIIKAWYEDIDKMEDEMDMFNLVRGAFQNDDALLLTGRLVYIWRKDPDEWNFPQG